MPSKPLLLKLHRWVALVFALPPMARCTILGIRTSLLTWDGLTHLALPAINLAIPNMALMVRLVAAGTSEAMTQDYVKYARAKGVKPRRIVTGQSAHKVRRGDADESDNASDGRCATGARGSAEHDQREAR